MDTNSRVIEIRNHLHQNPEPSECEEKTAAYLAAALKAAGFEVQEHVAGHGVIGLLKGKEKGPVMAVRGDMDALCHVDKDGKEIVVHSCGHDANCAMVLTAAEETAKKGIKRGALKILFQPAEENLVGARAMIKAGAVKDVDYLFGIHLRPIQEIRKGFATAELRHGSSSMIQISVRGQVCHGARPHLGVNAIDAALLISSAVNTIQEDPSQAWSAKTTMFNSNGKVINAVPDKVEMALDARAQFNPMMSRLLERIKTIVEYAPKAIGAEGTVDSIETVYAAEYDEEAISLLRTAIKDVMGEQALAPAILTPGGDDFHFYKHAHPSIKAGFLGLGADCTPGLHNPAMTFDESVLKDGVKLLEHVVDSLLN